MGGSSSAAPSSVNCRLSFFSVTVQPTSSRSILVQVRSWRSTRRRLRLQRYRGGGRTEVGRWTEAVHVAQVAVERSAVDAYHSIQVA